MLLIAIILVILAKPPNRFDRRKWT